MSELSKIYDPKAVESEIYQQWIERGSFHADPNAGGDPFCIVIPPPNVTAALHLGHALNNTLQDVLIRYRRMTGRNTLWMPGTDHAGIATQTVVEKRVLAEQGKRRTDFQRDEFVSLIQDWKDQYEQRITDQLKLIGCSCDWDRQRFTMDDVCARAVRTVFFRLFNEGLIYRGKRLVNWDPATQTVLADDEVEHETVEGHFWYLQYPLVETVALPDGQTVEHVTVATTRPETMLGDTAIAMNPADPRAEYLIGKKVRLPIVGRVIPIVGDDHVVLPDPDSDDPKAKFSTGFLKVTPAHDPDDYQIGERHLEEIAAVLAPQADPADVRKNVFINVMAPDGSISDRYGWNDADAPEAQNLIGMDRFEAREAIVEWFRSENLLENVREYAHEVGHSYRSHVPIEPYLSDQWYVAVKKPVDRLAEEFGDGEIESTDVPHNSLAGLALKPLLDGRLKFTPARYASNYRTWLENLRDWPISRQLWWGHRIPIWSRTFDLTPDNWERDFLRNIIDPLLEENNWCDPDAVSVRVIHAESGEAVQDLSDLLPITADTAGEYTVYVCPLDDSLAQPLAELGFQQDPDVLDTWFSSALWPFSTLKWPQESPLLKTFYPGHVLCTAREIITLWVSRMVMMGQYCRGDIPFSDVFIHAMIQDGQGRKMSKSLGNGIDPLDICDSHGADAMRFTLVSMTTQTQDVRMPVAEMELPDGRKVNSSPKFDIGRNFCNKLWNASRFAMMNLTDVPAWQDVNTTQALSDRWVLSRLRHAIENATAGIEQFRYNELADTLYHFVWDDFCDWYLEVAKVRIAGGDQAPKAIVAHVLDCILKMLHPVAPFITEEIWQKLGSLLPSRGPQGQAADMLISAPWPGDEAGKTDPAAEREFQLLQEVIREIRNVRTQNNVPPSQKVDAILQAPQAECEVFERNLPILQAMANLESTTVTSEQVDRPANAAAAACGNVQALVLGVVDREAEVQRLAKQKETLLKGIGGIKGKLGNENFLTKAPEQVVQRERERLEQLEGELQAVEDALQAIQP